MIRLQLLNHKAMMNYMLIDRLIKLSIGHSLFQDQNNQKNHNPKMKNLHMLFDTHLMLSIVRSLFQDRNTLHRSSYNSKMGQSLRKLTMKFRSI